MWLCIQWCKHWLKWMTCKHILSTEKFELCKSKMTPLTGWLEKESKWLCRWNKRYVKLFVVTSAGTASNVDDIRKSMSQSRWGWCSLFLDKIQHLCTGKLYCSQLDGDVLSYNHGNYLSCISWGTEKTVCHVGSLWSEHSNNAEGVHQTTPEANGKLRSFTANPGDHEVSRATKAGGHHLCLKLPWVTIEGTLSTMISFNADWHCHWSCQANFLFWGILGLKQGEVDR